MNNKIVSNYTLVFHHYDYGKMIIFGLIYVRTQ